jgi:hypothetical protein
MNRRRSQTRQKPVFSVLVLGDVQRFYGAYRRSQRFASRAAREPSQLIDSLAVETGHVHATTGDNDDMTARLSLAVLAVPLSVVFAIASHAAIPRCCHRTAKPILARPYGHSAHDGRICSNQRKDQFRCAFCRSVAARLDRMRCQGCTCLSRLPVLSGFFHDGLNRIPRDTSASHKRKREGFVIGCLTEQSRSNRCLNPLVR